MLHFPDLLRPLGKFEKMLLNLDYKQTRRIDPKAEQPARLQKLLRHLTYFQLQVYSTNNDVAQLNFVQKTAQKTGPKTAPKLIEKLLFSKVLQGL